MLLNGYKRQSQLPNTMTNQPDLLSDTSPMQQPTATPTANGTSDNIASALSSPPPTTTEQTKPPKPGWGNLMGGLVSTAQKNLATSSSSLTDAASSFSNNVNLAPLSNFTKTLSHNLTGKSTLLDKTTASQVLMFRQLLHTNCRPGLRLSRGYEGTNAQKAVLHMPVSFDVDYGMIRS